MVLLRCTREDYEVLYEGDYSFLIDMMENITTQKEDIGEMFVNEYTVNKNSLTTIREFASIDDGLVDSLIICDSVINTITKK